MRYVLRPKILSAAVGLGLFWLWGEGSGQAPLASGAEADVTAEGLHRVDPSIMQAAWVKPGFDLAAYTRILLMPTAVQFREVVERPNNARTRISTEEFSVSEERRQWMRNRWSEAVIAQFARQRSFELYEGPGSDVLIVQGFLVDVVSRIPPESVGSAYTLVTDPWSVSVVLELRDGASAELLARTIDRRNARGLVDEGAVWHQTEDLIERWAAVLSERLEQLSSLGGREGLPPARVR